MPAVEVSDRTFRRLQRHAIPFVDTPESVINRAFDAFELSGNGVSSSAESPTESPNARQLSVDTPGSLKHTKIVSSTFDGKPAANWNELLVLAHAVALQRLGDFDAVKQHSASSIVRGQRDDSGFHFQSGLGLSIQYVDSNNAWRQVLHLARQLQVDVNALFMWREKEGAAYPGEFGRLRWFPGKSISGEFKIHGAPRNGAGKKNAAFHSKMVATIERALNIILIRRSRIIWSSVDGNVAVSCRASKEVQKDGISTFWFGLSPGTIERLEAAPSSMCAFGLGKASRIVLLPLEFVSRQLPDLGTSPEPDGSIKHWHIHFRLANGIAEMATKGTSDWVSVEEFRVKNRRGNNQP